MLIKKQYKSAFEVGMSKEKHLKKIKINNKLRKIKKFNNTNRIQFSTITLIIRNKFRIKLSEKTK